jgi:hypothetical protein
MHYAQDQTFIIELFCFLPQQTQKDMFLRQLVRPIRPLAVKPLVPRRSIATASVLREGHIFVVSFIALSFPLIWSNHPLTVCLR